LDKLNHKIIEEYLYLHQYDEIKEVKKESWFPQSDVDVCELL
jgi:hypothetical protein